MMKACLFPAALIAATLSGCATPLPPASATRFHRIDAATPMTPGSYIIGSPAGVDALHAPDPSYTAAVARQLDGLGFRALTASDCEGAPACGPDYLVSVFVERTERDAPSAGGPVSVGVGGSTGSYGSGIGVGVGINLSSLLGHRRGLIATRMSVRIARNGEEQALWEGRAETLARMGTPAAQAGLDADKLARALFVGFPGRPGETISVP